MPSGTWPDDDCLQICQRDEADTQNQCDRVYALYGANVVREERSEHAKPPKHKRQDRQAEVTNEMSKGRRHQRLDDGNAIRRL